jgi:NTE family protein
LGQAVVQWRTQLRGRAQDKLSVFTNDADIYFINASLSELEDQDQRARVMKIPTNLSLAEDEVDQLLLAASKLIRDDKEFQRLLRDLEEESATTPLISQPADELTPP